MSRSKKLAILNVAERALTFQRGKSSWELLGTWTLQENLERVPEDDQKIRATYESMLRGTDCMGE